MILQQQLQETFSSSWSYSSPLFVIGLLIFCWFLLWLNELYYLMSIPKGLSAVERSYFILCTHAGFSQPNRNFLRNSLRLTTFINTNLIIKWGERHEISIWTRLRDSRTAPLSISTWVSGSTGIWNGETSWRARARGSIKLSKVITR